MSAQNNKTTFPMILSSSLLFFELAQRMLHFSVRWNNRKHMKLRISFNLFWLEPLEYTSHCNYDFWSTRKNFPGALEDGLYTRCQKRTPIMVQIQIHPVLHNPTQKQKSSTNPLNISVWTAVQSLVCPPNLDLLDLVPYSHSVALCTDLLTNTQL